LDCSPASQAEENAKNKALAASDGDSSEIIVAADTIVVLEGKILGKPKDKTEAFDSSLRLRAKDMM